MKKLEIIIFKITTGQNMTANIKKSIFPNAKTMNKDEEDRLIRRAIVYSFTLGLIRPKNVNISIYVLFAGFVGFNFSLLEIIDNFFGDNLLLSTGLVFLEFFYVSYYFVLLYQITKLREPEKFLNS